MPADASACAVAFLFFLFPALLSSSDRLCRYARVSRNISRDFSHLSLPHSFALSLHADAFLPSRLTWGHIEGTTMSVSVCLCACEETTAEQSRETCGKGESVSVKKETRKGLVFPLPSSLCPVPETEKWWKRLNSDTKRDSVALSVCLSRCYSDDRDGTRKN